MNNTVKRIWTLILAIAMIASMFTVAAVAEEEQTFCDANGHTWETVSTLREGSCKVAGVYKEQCLVCKETQYANRYVHNFVPDFVDATCTQPQKYGEVCTLCGETNGAMKDVEGSVALGHDWEETIVEASCKSAAGVQKVCKRANCKVTDFVPFEGEMADAQKPHQYEAADVAATCTTKGLSGAYVCKLCGEKDPSRPGTETPIDASKHELEIGTTMKEATCTANGIGKMVCKLCKKEQGYGTIPAGHKYVETVVKAVTCTEDGIVNKKCSACDVEVKNVVVEATGDHIYEEILIDATCEEPAKYGEACTMCHAAKGELKTVAGSEALGHDFAEEIVDATCTQPSGIKKTCTREGCKVSMVVAIEGEHQDLPLDHCFVEEEEIKATCKTTGWKGKTVCTRCGEVEFDGDETPIDPNAHKPMLSSTMKEATCETNGVGKSVCELCGKELGYITIPAEHKWVDTIIEAATCTEAGKMDRLCSVCGKEAKNVEIVATGKHNYVETIVDATCKEAAKVGMVCTMCEAVDENGYEKIPGSEKLGHEYVDELVEATCEQPSGIKKTCTRCGDSYVEAIVGVDQVPALTHKEKKVDDIAATCTTKGWTGKVICERCDKVIEEGHETPVAADAHKGVVGTVMKAADCKTGANGIGKSVCELCGKDLGYTTIEAKHNWEDTILEAATCIKAGKMDRLCTVCGEEEKDVEIEATKKHNYVETFVDATCEQPAKVGKVCTMCEEVDEKGFETIQGSKALGHDFDEKVIEADCTHAAGILKTCKREGCDEEVLVPFEDEDNKQDALDHVEKTVEAIAATCKTTGWTEKVVCERCGKVLDEGELVNIDADAHKSVVGTTMKAADCKTGTSGIGKMVCELCGKDLGYGTIKAEHQFEETIIEAPTCTKAGKKDLLCTVCGYEQKDVVIAATDKHNYVETFVDATCTAAAKYGNVCTMCEQVDAKGWTIVKDSKELGHDFVETVVEATCEHKSGILRVCQREGCEYSDVIAISGVAQDEALPHTPVESEDNIKATCKTDGWEGKMVCEVCGKVTAEGHKVEAGTDHHDKVLAATMKEATCKTNGIGKYVCSVCGEDMGYGVIDAGHKYEETITEAATCGKAGKKDLVCSVCGDTLKDQPISATGKHDYKEAFVDATCTEPAMYGDVCTVCGAKKGAMQPVTGSEKLGHSFEEEVIEADCDHGAGVKKTCTVCEVVEYEAFTGDMAVPAKGHKYVEADIVANCKNPGTTGRTACSVCGKVENEGEPTPIDPNTHKEAIDKVLKEATCTKAGTASYKCELCGVSTGYKAFTAEHAYSEEKVDRDGLCIYKECVNCGKVEIVESFTEETCAHTFAEVKAVEPTTEKNGMTAGKKCSKCGLVLYGCEVIPPVDCVHVAGEAVVENEVAATCTTAGTYDEVVYCTLCGDEMTRETKETELAEHTAEAVAAVEPTCTETGLTEGSKCSVCGEVLVAQEEVEAKGHTEEVVPAKEATCKEDGLTEGIKCSVCDAVIKAQESVPSAGIDHVEVAVAGKEATCTEDGLTAGSKCTVCDTVIKAQETIPAKGHTEETIPAKAPTCTEDGLTEGKKCSVCGATIKAQEKDAAKGHNEVTVSGKAATCTEDGLTDGSKCSTCGATIVAQEKISAKGHSYKVSYTYNADYTKETTHYECRNCGHSYTDEHDF